MSPQAPTQVTVARVLVREARADSRSVSGSASGGASNSVSGSASSSSTVVHKNKPHFTIASSSSSSYSATTDYRHRHASSSSDAPSASSGSDGLISSSSAPAVPTVTTPLTTMFKPDAGCGARGFTFSTVQNGVSTFWHHLGGQDSVCYPDGFSPQTSTVYSPGICPSGYAGYTISAATPSAKPSKVVHTSFCCPLHLRYVQGTGCIATITTPTEVFLNPTHKLQNFHPFIARDYALQVQWASTDLHLFTPASAPLLLMASATPSTSASSNSTFTASGPNTPAGATPDSSDLPHSMTVGVSVGVAALVCSVFAVGVFAMWRRKRRRPRATPGANEALISEKSGEEGAVGQAAGYRQAEQEESEVQGPEGEGYVRLSEELTPSLRQGLQGSGWQHWQVGSVGGGGRR